MSEDALWFYRSDGVKGNKASIWKDKDEWWILIAWEDGTLTACRARDLWTFRWKAP